jgi:hypothetical protein
MDLDSINSSSDSTGTKTSDTWILAASHSLFQQHGRSDVRRALRADHAGEGMVTKSGQKELEGCLRIIELILARNSLGSNGSTT